MPLDAEISADIQGVEAELVQAPQIQAAGIVFRAKSTGRVLFLKRGDNCDHPGMWCGAGGKIEDGETPAKAAIRECGEEMGLTAGDEMASADSMVELARLISPEVDFTAFLEDVPDEFAPALNFEHTAWAWADPAEPPQPVHPNMAVLMARLAADELGVARLMAHSGLASPQRYQNVWLFDVRITGTGAAYRPSADEFVWRDTALYLNEEFLARCNGLPLIFEHPEDSLLNSDEFSNRIVGTIFLPYIKGDEVWGIAKVWDDETAALMSKRSKDGHALSTSPGVDGVGKDFHALEDGRTLLIEGKPSLVDHLAICKQGVWDKALDPSGVRLDSIDQGEPMAEAEDKKADAAEDKPDPVMDAISKLSARFDAFEAGAKAKADSDDEKKPPSEKAIEEEAKPDADEDDKEEGKDDKKPDSDDKDEKKADSVSRADFEALRRSIPVALTDADMNELAEVQSRVDAVAASFGEKPLRPMHGEKPIQYRRRMAAKYQDHSEDWRGVDLSTLPAPALGVAEKAIFAAASAKADSFEAIPEGQLRESRHVCPDTGRITKEFHGSPSVWMDAHKMRPKFARHIGKGS